MSVGQLHNKKPKQAVVVSRCMITSLFVRLASGCDVGALVRPSDAQPRCLQLLVREDGSENAPVEGSRS